LTGVHLRSGEKIGDRGLRDEKAFHKQSGYAGKRGKGNETTFKPGEKRTESQL